MTIGVTWGAGIQIEGTPFRLVVPGSETSGHAVVLTVDMPPGLHVDAHTHDSEEQINIVISGQVRFRVGDEEAVLGAGGVLLMPRGVEHELWNDTAEFARIVEVYTPPGMEQTICLGRSRRGRRRHRCCRRRRVCRHACDLSCQGCPVIQLRRVSLNSSGASRLHTWPTPSSTTSVESGSAACRCSAT